MVDATVIDLEAMDFAHRLVATRKQRGLTQQGVADAIGVHLSQVRRYEAGSSQPTLDVLKRMAVGLSVTIDQLAFGEDERGPGDELRLHLEAAGRLDPDEQDVVRSVIEGLMLKPKPDAGTPPDPAPWDSHGRGSISRGDVPALTRPGPPTLATGPPDPRDRSPERVDTGGPPTRTRGRLPGSRAVRSGAGVKVQRPERSEDERP